ncbi:MAG: ABC transporter ATP-binding protein, partial [Lachnospiraceae bacterium]|nr:ABC transporter ATP-binding protein [Lachnospiraceae bacterium]
PVSKYSRGMAVKLMFAAAFSRVSKLLVLDEATNGLDPVVRREVLELLQEYICDGEHSVLFSTHIMEDLSGIADFIFFIDEGEEVFCDTKDAVLERFVMVKGPASAFSERDGLIGVKENEFGAAAIFDLSKGTDIPEGVVTEKATIDQIVVHTIADRKRRENCRAV